MYARIKKNLRMILFDHYMNAFKKANIQLALSNSPGSDRITIYTAQMA